MQQSVPRQYDWRGVTSTPALRKHVHCHALRSLLISRWRHPYSHCVEPQSSGIANLPSNRGGVPRGRRHEIPGGPARRDVVDAHNPRVVGSTAAGRNRCNKGKKDVGSKSHRRTANAIWKILRQRLKLECSGVLRKAKEAQRGNRFSRLLLGAINFTRSQRTLMKVFLNVEQNAPCRL